MKKVIIFGLLVIILTGCEVKGEQVEGNNRFGLDEISVHQTIITDKETECKYLVVGEDQTFNGVTPLYNADGQIEGCKNIKR